MKNTFLLLFLFYVVPISAQPRFNNPAQFLSEYTKKTGWEKWNDKSTLKIIHQDEGHTDGEAIFVYEGNHSTSQIGKNLNNHTYFQTVNTPEVHWFRNTNGQVRVSHTPSDQIMAMYASTSSSPCPELRISTGFVDLWEISEGIFEEKSVYILSQEMSQLGMKKLYYYDKETLFRIANYVEKGIGAGTKITYSDFRQVQGVWMPFKETITGVAYPRNRLVLSAEFDVDVSEYFKLPEGAPKNE